MKSTTSRSRLVNRPPKLRPSIAMLAGEKGLEDLDHMTSVCLVGILTKSFVRSLKHTNVG